MKTSRVTRSLKPRPIPLLFPLSPLNFLQDRTEVAERRIRDSGSNLVQTVLHLKLVTQVIGNSIARSVVKGG